jgi:hypothetical protein
LRILHYQLDSPPLQTQVAAREKRHILAIKQDLSRPRILEADDGARQRALTRSGLANYPKSLASIYREANAIHSIYGGRLPDTRSRPWVRRHEVSYFYGWYRDGATARLLPLLD